MFAGNFAPAGWMFCDGQLLPISENETLFQLIGTTYGGDGQSTFQLPNLQSRVPVHMGSDAGTTYQLAETGGVESVTLTTQQIPTHTHPFVASTATGTETDPTNNLPARSLSVLPYRQTPPVVNFNAQKVNPTGGSQPHENLQPYLAISFIISLFGIFPSPT
jgi:microcystin-dependent protein